MICSAVAVVVFSDSSDADSEGDDGDIHWAITGDTLTITKRGGDGVIPSYASDYPRAPWQGFGGSTLVIGDNITEIGTYNFYELGGLTSVTLPDTLIEIRNSAFWGCSSLGSITIPSSVNKLGYETFNRCSSLTSVTFAGEIKGLEENTFSGSSVRAVYYNSGSVDMSKWPDQDIMFISANGGTITNGPAVELNDPKFPDISGVYTPPSGAFKAYKIGDTYYGAGDYMPEGKVKADIWHGAIADFKVGVLFLTVRGSATDPQILDYTGTPVTAAEPSDPTAAGYTFDAWCLSLDGTKTWDFATPVYRNIVLYAKWTGDATVTFNIMGHGTAPNPIEVEMGSKIEKPADPTAEGYKFNGWYKEMTCQTKWNFDDPVADDMTLYAEWIVQPCRVTFDMMGHGLGPDPQIVNYGDQVTEPADISIEGYTFGGWFKDVSFENKWDFDTDFVNSDTVLYAKWVSNSSEAPSVPIWTIPLVIIGTVVVVGAGIAMFRR